MPATQIRVTGIRGSVESDHGAPITVIVPNMPANTSTSRGAGALNSAEASSALRKATELKKSPAVNSCLTSPPLTTLISYALVVTDPEQGHPVRTDDLQMVCIGDPGGWPGFPGPGVSRGLPARTAHSG